MRRFRVGEAGRKRVAVTNVAIVGFGKIAHDQHVPSIAGNPAFHLAAIVSQRGVGVDGVPVFRSLGELARSGVGVDAIAVCTPPQVRHVTAREALAMGKHVLLEKPPAATLSELDDLVWFAEGKDRVLYATWHAQYNAAVAEARRRLAGKRVTRLQVNWKEDVRRWHPGQAWIWQAGGFGVFDPGINALSIVSRIIPTPVFVRSADLTFPSNRDAPIAATLTFATADVEKGLAAVFDWRQTGPQTWEIEVDTADGGRLKLENGGATLVVDGQPTVVKPMREYEEIYARFAELLAADESDVDVAPLRLVADAFLVGRRLVTDAFLE
jgi:D-galactose 1-dehydrogenase